MRLEISDEVNGFLLTVSSEDYQTPDWFKGGVMYQIFPDRFCKKGSMPDITGRIARNDWGGEPTFRPNEQGKVLNNDFFGGNFKGITEKLDYIASLGVTILYLNPISKSFSSHRYDTGDYKTPDPMLGTIEDFREMCDAAHKRGMKVILDGVYSHTGSNSLYFNKYGTFKAKGAYNSKESPFYNWFTFHNWPDSYNSWWDFDTLPTVKKMEKSFLDYIINDEDSVVAYWLEQGCDGFRLDVVDELPNEFVRLLKQRIRQIRPDALLIGEVWEDASNKHSYGVRRRYFVDGILDSAMNYPFRTAIINFVRGFDSGKGLKNTVMSIVENYPQEVVHCNMNLLGTHDTPRILTALVDNFEGDREAMARRFLTRNQVSTAEERLLTASFLQYMLPGCPSLYYGDEAGMEGYKDPFNRRTYPWGREDWDMVNHFKRLGKLRKENPALRLGDIQFFEAGDKHLGYTRSYQGKTYRIYVNRSGDPWDIPAGKLLMGHNLRTVAPNWLSLAPQGFCVVEE